MEVVFQESELERHERCLQLQLLASLPEDSAVETLVGSFQIHFAESEEDPTVAEVMQYQEAVEEEVPVVVPVLVQQEKG